jgi:hypothetical protein
VQEHLPAGRQESKKCDNLSRFFDKKAGNNLPLLSVLSVGFWSFFIFSYFFFNVWHQRAD